MNYECKRCEHKTNQKIEMIRHLNRKNKCKRTLNSYKYNDNEINDLSLIRLNNNSKNNDLNNDLNNELKTELINKKKDKKIYLCECCDKKFSRKFNLERHNDICKKKIFTNNYITNNTIQNNTIHNTIHNNISINFKLEPYDGDWNISKINKFTRQSIIFSNIMYTNLLKLILENESNLNVIIDKDKNEGIIYKNDIEKLIKVNLKDIIDNSMYKLNKHLNDFYTETISDVEYKIINNMFEEQKNIIQSKYEDYKNNKETQKIVEKYITNIYDTKKDDTLIFYRKILLENKGDDLLEGF